MNWLLIRGLSREQRHWGPFPTVMAEALGETVHTIDPPGFGTQTASTSPSTMSAITNDIRARFQASIVEVASSEERWGILGISLGGMVAMDWCEQHPNDFDACVVVNTSTRLSPPWSRFRPASVPVLLGSRLRKGDAAERATLDISLNRPDHDYEALARQFTAWSKEASPSSASLRGQVVAALRYSAPKRLATPLLILTSDGDRLVSADCSRQLARHLDAPLRVHPDGGHDLAMDDPTWICEQIRSWDATGRG